MDIRKSAAVTALLLLLTAGWAMADDADVFFEVTNTTGFVLAALHVSPQNIEEWGGNLLGDNPLLDGETIRIPVDSLDDPIVDIRARDNEGDTYTVHSVDAGVEDISITLNDIDPD